MSGLFVCDDLIFTSRVTATARAHGLVVRTARTAEAALELAQAQPPVCVILDLHSIPEGLPGFLAALHAVCPIRPRVIGYGSHVNKELLQSARDAGCDPVLPRSQFARELETSLPDWMAASGALQSSRTEGI